MYISKQSDARHHKKVFIAREGAERRATARRPLSASPRPCRGPSRSRAPYQQASGRTLLSHCAR
eukprot:scaffold113276_cov69-Phaeocystis_antarctica.AAC.5